MAKKARGCFVAQILLVSLGCAANAGDGLTPASLFTEPFRKKGRVFVLPLTASAEDSSLKAAPPPAGRLPGKTGLFYPATAGIDGNTILVSSGKVAEPEAVRFGFTNGAEPNLFNEAGLPASPFRTDEWTVSE
jgi:hypothetical protein